jgi:hypothetical protein
MDTTKQGHTTPEAVRVDLYPVSSAACKAFVMVRIGSIIINSVRVIKNLNDGTLYAVFPDRSGHAIVQFTEPGLQDEVSRVAIAAYKQHLQSELSVRRVS